MTGLPAPPAERLLGSTGRTARRLLAVLTGLAVAWSFAWVATRPWRQAETRGEGIELTVLHWGDHLEDGIVAELSRSFEASHPTLRVRRINAEADYFAKLRTMLAAGDAPDVVFLNSTDVAHYAKRGLLLDVEPYLLADERAGRGPDRADFFAETLASFRFDGAVSGRGPLYGLPSSFTPLGFYYNKDLFDRAGVAYPSDRWTWKEFAAKARAIAAATDAYGAELLVARPDNLRVILWTWGLDLLSPGLDRLRLDEPGVRAVLERLWRWRFHHPRMLAETGSRVATGRDLFLAGKVGMLGPSGRWLVPLLRRIDDFDWDFAQLPRGSRSANMLYVAAWCIPRASRHPAAAWELARHFATPEGQRKNAAPGLALPTLRSVAASRAFLDPDRRPRRDDLYLAAVPGARPMQWPTDSAFRERLERRLEEILVLGRLTVAEGLEAIRRDWCSELRSPLRRGRFPPMPWGKIAAAAIAAALLGLTAVVRGFRRRRPRGLAAGEELAGLGMISPWVFGFAAFTAFPMGLSLLLSATRWSGITPLAQAEWVGWANYAELLGHDERFSTSLWVTLYYVLLAVPLGQAVALGAALLMHRRLRGIEIFRAAWYLPSILAGVAVAILWRWVFDGRHGLLNRVLEPLLAILGLRPPDWFGADAALFGVPAFALLSLWSVGGMTVIYLAGLAAIPETLYDAARIDGAGAWRRFIHVTLPMLSPVILFNGIIALIGSFQVFTQAYVMTDGGPGDLTRFYVLYLYDQAFELHAMGYASAMAWLLFAIVFGLTLVALRRGRRFVFYGGLRW